MPPPPIEHADFAGTPVVLVHVNGIVLVLSPTLYTDALATARVILAYEPRDRFAPGMHQIRGHGKAWVLIQYGIKAQCLLTPAQYEQARQRGKAYRRWQSHEALAHSRAVRDMAAGLEWIEDERT